MMAQLEGYSGIIAGSAASLFFISSGAVSLKACTQCLVFAIIY
jgi:hypothetical protein